MSLFAIVRQLVDWFRDASNSYGGDSTASTESEEEWLAVREVAKSDQFERGGER